MESEYLIILVHQFFQIGSEGGWVYEDKIFLVKFLQPPFLLKALSNS